MAVKSTEIWHRDDFALLCNWRKLWRVVEVGVESAEFSQTFLSRWLGGPCGGEYFGIDPYLPYPEMDYPRDSEFLVATMRYERFASVAKLIRSTSEDVVKKVQNGSVDFVYIDARHDYDSVVKDLARWWPKLSEKGILAGHDYDDTHPGVIAAVDKIFEKHEVYLTHEKETIPSWYVYKSGIPGPDWKRAE